MAPTKPTMPTLADWRAQVDKELAGAAFDQLVTATPEGLQLQPLYTETRVAPGLPGEPPFTRGGSAEARPFQICMRVDPVARRRPGALAEDLDGGADALWAERDDAEAIAACRARGLPMILGEVLERDAAPPRTGRVSSIAFHDAGADAADELALMLASAATQLREQLAHGAGIDVAAATLWAQVAVGRDTFGELCKLRALRVVWHKLLTAAGAKDSALSALHAVCSSRTQSQRDPWVNLLRVSTQVFAAALGGAQLITPLPFDDALDARSAHGRRVARNTALVLREESHLGRVIDAAGGSYYIEERTDALAREAWARFTQIERDGGLGALIAGGGLRERLARSWAAFAARKEPVLGVSEFVNADEPLPVAGPAAPPPPPALVPHREAEAFGTMAITTAMATTTMATMATMATMTEPTR